MSDKNLLSVFDRVTQKIIADLEQGVRPWQKPWGGNHAGPRIVRPRRHNGEPYNGVNILLLWDAAIEKGYQNPTWMTFVQADEYGAKVRKGEKSSFVVYANKVTKTEIDDKTGDTIEKQIPFLRGYHVFNVEQIEGLPEKFLLKPEPPQTGATTVERLEGVDTFIKHTGAIVRHGGDRAFYAEGPDYIQMPVIDAFKDSESYYATLAHEASHWTKHEKRLDRDFGRVVWGDEGYAKEELVAEIGSAFLCADLGITPETREDHAAYIESWLKALKDDKKLIFTAAAHATRAVEYLKAKQPILVPGVRPEDEIAFANKTLYVSEPMQIGNHQWRMLIGYNDLGSVGTRYEFQDQSGSFWHEQRSWPQYNINSTYLGLPRGLAKLYEREQPALIKFGLTMPPAPSKQIEMRF
jgi:antirestriction protein ArdC